MVFSVQNQLQTSNYFCLRYDNIDSMKNRDSVEKIGLERWFKRHTGDTLPCLPFTIMPLSKLKRNKRK